MLPRFWARPQGGGRAALDDWAVFTAIVYVLTSGCAWRHLPPSFGVSVPTAHRRFATWVKAGCSTSYTGKLSTGSEPAGTWTGPPRSSTPPTSRRKGGSLTGRSPVDRGKKGSRIHVLSDADGIPLLTAVTSANTHDSVMLQPMVSAIPAVRSRRGPRRRRPGRLRADKGYDAAVHRRWLSERGIVPRIARRGVDTSERLGRYRRKIERTLAWLTGFRRLTIRYERHGEHFAGFLRLAAALTCWKKLTK
nr:IS5 family transposase [Rhodococcus ruber]